MQKFAYSLALLLVMSATPASALTLDRSSSMNGDGTAKFADPDDQAPPGLTAMPSEDGTPVQPSHNNMTMQLAPGAGLGLSVNNGFGQAPSGDAFDRAYGHFGNR